MLACVCMYIHVCAALCNAINFTLHSVFPILDVSINYNHVEALCADED